MKELFAQVFKSIRGMLIIFFKEMVKKLKGLK